MRASTHAPTTLKGCPNRSWRTWRAFVRTPGTDSYLWTANSAGPSRKCIRRAIFVGSSKAFESTIRKKMLVRILLDVSFRVFRFPWQFCNTTVIICVAFRGDMRFFFFFKGCADPWVPKISNLLFKACKNESRFINGPDYDKKVNLFCRVFLSIFCWGIASFLFTEEKRARPF